jgi:hypothetical protein
MGMKCKKDIEDCVHWFASALAVAEKQQPGQMTAARFANEQTLAVLLWVLETPSEEAELVEKGLEKHRERLAKARKELGVSDVRSH